jgi:NADH-quinone oxidoreductase subunit H
VLNVQTAQVWLATHPNESFALWAFIKIFVILNLTLVVVSYLVWAERKLCGRMQGRFGPNRVGVFGLLQPWADVIKLFLKEQFTPATANKAIFNIAPGLAIVPALISFSIVPFGPGITVTDINVGLLLFLAMSSIGVYAVTLGGWSSNNKYALIGGLRSSAQMISYELAMGISTIGVLLLAGSLSMVDIVKAQSGTLPVLGLPLPGWFIFYQPVAFVIFMLTALAETNRTPFDLAEAESELVAGFHTEYSSMGFGLFFLGEYANIITICSIAVTLFLGGWNGPWLPEGLKFIWFFVKLVVLVFCFIWARWTLPRFRYDQLMSLGWKVLLPVSILHVMLTAVIVYARLPR